MLDFDDLELEAAALLAGHEEVRAHWSERFELIMVDELQDTNARQMALLAALDRDNLFTVGDEFQSIYGFRHADVGLFRERYASLARSRRGGRALGELPLAPAAARRGQRGLRAALRRALRAARSPAGPARRRRAGAAASSCSSPTPTAGSPTRSGSAPSWRPRRCGGAPRRGCWRGASTS